ncbi:dermonecrotic toxin domain-containing protein [Pseudomonas khavaziana]|uniref:Dermonecrotic toxin N-terminal domain-containing protein n=1 Tax=Pseudomonas khavaziana TaxID=2842351 RepID=A0ABZ2DHX2_9PSED
MTDPTFAPQARPLLQRNIDETLLWDATQRWQDCHREMLALMAGIPSVRNSINRLLRDQLQLDGEQVVLEFAATEQRGRSRISLTEACLYMQQHPGMDTAQVPQGKLLYLPAQHTLAQYSVAQWLDELKGLDLEQAIDDNWLRYWRTERAPYAPVTCLKRAFELYRAHFEASAERLLAEGKINAEVLAPLFSLLHPVGAAAPALYVEQVLLKPADSRAITLPGAWVLTVDNEQPVNQLLYLPTHAPLWHPFTQRTDMERWLLDRQQELFSTRASDPLATIEYKLNTKPLEAGISLWLTQLTKEQYQNAIRPLADVTIDNAFLARLHIDQLDAQRPPPFCVAPPLPESDASKLAQQDFPQFGQLHNAVDAGQRMALVLHHRNALESLFADEMSSGPNGTRWQSFKQQLDALKVQQQAAEQAARAMLKRRPLDLTTLNIQYTALYQARLQGIRIEARIQRNLEQISAEDLQQIESALDTPEPNIVALALSITQSGTSKNTELKGPLVILPPSGPQAPTRRDGTHFIYWPGSDGALQRFASRQALEEGLFRIQPEDEVLALHFVTLAEDPFDYSLRAQQSAFEEQAAQLRQTWSAPEHAARLTGELENLYEQTLPTLLIPDHSAREAAFLQLVEQYNSRWLTEQLPPWLLNQPPQDQAALKTLLDAYIHALKHAQALQDRSLLPRDVFVRQQIDARLRKDFALDKGFTVQLELPDSVTQKRDIIAGAAPGTPVKTIDIPSAKRSKISLEELALRNIGSDINLRLGFMSTEVTADDPAERATLQTGVTAVYLTGMVPDLNLAKRYEDLILETFRGVTRESAHQKNYRRECLIEPWRLTLKAQGLLARMQNHINADELRLLNIAIDADTHAAWNIDAKHISLLPATLSAGGKDTQEQSPITLSGITFIEEKISGKTLLYLPEAPDQRCLRSYASLNQARIALFELCRLDSMVEYVAGRAIKGNVRAHIGRIDQATVKGYDAIIQAGFPWPATTSLAAHQLNAYMGRLIEAHRNDARSNADLAHEKYALKSGQLFNGIKIALNFVPFIGTALSLADATTSLYQAVAAFQRGETAHGIDQLASVFDCLVYAALDALTLAAAPGTRASKASQLARARQLQPAARASFWRSLKSRQGTTTRQRFAGYEHPEPLEPGSLRPVHSGPYRHTLRHTSGEHFILSEGRHFKVRYEATTHEMRLVASGKYYSPIIALDHALHWDTYSVLHGGHLTGYSGGSRRPGRGSRRPGASVPAAVERQTPAAVSQVNQQRRATLLEIGRLSDEFDAQILVSQRELTAFEQQFALPVTPADTAQRLKTTKTLDALMARDIESAKQVYTATQRAAGFDGHTLRQDITFNQSRTALVVGDRLMRQGINANRRLLGLQDQIVDLSQRRQKMRSYGPEDLAAQDALKRIRIEWIDDMNSMGDLLRELDTWLPRITVPSMKTKVVPNVTKLQTTYTERAQLLLKTGHLLQCLHGQRQPSNISWAYQEVVLQDAMQRLDRTLVTHLQLPTASLSKAQRNQMLQNIIEVYGQFHRDLSTWHLVSPSHFDPLYVQPLLDHLSQLMDTARRGIKQAHTRPQTSAGRVPFETEDGQLLMGTEQPARQQSPRQFIVTNEAGKTVEVWDQVSDSQRYRLNTTLSQPAAAAPAVPGNLTEVVSEAGARLAAVDAFEHKVRAYKNLEPINLEHLLVSEAQALESRASQVQRLDANHPLIAQLRSRAAPLKAAGQALRIERTLASKTPTEGYLDYLMDQNRVEIRKLGARRELKLKRPDGTTDHLQEYAVHDRQQTADKPLWYAHFHYLSADSGFESFTKAHLKIPDQRLQGLHWQIAAEGRGVTFADLKIWRGNIDKPIANKHFSAIQ